MENYNDSSFTYDDETLLYEGLEIDSFALVVDNEDIMEYVADRSLSVRTGTHGNSQGTLDFILNNPLSIPTVDDEASLFVNFENLFSGLVKVTDIKEYHGGYLFVDVGAQDEGPEWDGVPTAAPFGISDDPDGVTTIGYESLVVQNRTTEGGTAKQTAKVVIRQDGFLPGMNVELTSANHGWVAQEFAISEVQAEWPTPDAPRYTLGLGDPIVHLENVIDELEVADGSITTTKIADNAITTPKLSADAVIANVVNVAGTVAITSSGIAVSQGSISVYSPDSTVIIDGSSNMFKIAATGTRSLTETGGGTADASNSITLGSLGSYTTPPQFLSLIKSYVSGGSAPADARSTGIYLEGGSSGGVYDVLLRGALTLSVTVDDELSLSFHVSNNSGSTRVYEARYYILEEAGI